GRSPRGREPGLSGLAPRRSVATERTLRSAPGARKSAPAPPGGHYAFVQVKGVFTDQTAANHTGGVRRPPCRPGRRSARRRGAGTPPRPRPRARGTGPVRRPRHRGPVLRGPGARGTPARLPAPRPHTGGAPKIGRTSCRERVEV